MNNNMNFYIQWFNNYTHSFTKAFPSLLQNIEIKRAHSLRVHVNSRTIGKSLGLDTSSQLLAEVAGLYHDIGRFRQYTEYKTFSDKNSIDHGNLGKEVLEETNILENFSDSEKEIILSSVRFHNKKFIPDTLNKEEVFFTKITRDADKVDIYKLITDHYLNKNENADLILNLPENNEYNPLMIKEIKNRTIADISHIKNLNDFRLLQISWVYDLHFKKSFEIILENNYLNILFDFLPRNREIKELNDEIMKYIDNHVLKQV